MHDAGTRNVGRVLMTTDCVGGVFSFTTTLARELSGRGVRVTVVTMGPRMAPDQRAELARVGSLTVHETDFALEWMNDPWADVARAGGYLLELTRVARPDVIHFNGYALAALRWPAPTVVVAHSCILSWWRAVHREPAPVRYRAYARHVTGGLRAASAVVAPTAAMLENIEAHYAICPNGFVIPNGVPPAGRAGREKEPLVLAAGRVWDPAKGLARLAAVAPRLPWRVVVAGSDLHPDGTRRALPNVDSIGAVPSSVLADWMERASVFAHPARYEPFGLAPLEAAMRGAALVLGDIPSLREVWKDAALYVPPDDDVALERAIKRLIEDVALRGELGRRAVARARMFTADETGRAYLTLYEAVVRAGTLGVTPEAGRQDRCA